MDVDDRTTTTKARARVSQDPAGRSQSLRAFFFGVGRPRSVLEEKEAKKRKVKHTPASRQQTKCLQMKMYKKHKLSQLKFGLRNGPWQR